MRVLGPDCLNGRCSFLELSLWPWHLADFKKAGQGNSNTFSISLFSLSKFVDPDPDILASILLVLDYLMDSSDRWGCVSVV